MPQTRHAEADCLPTTAEISIAERVVIRTIVTHAAQVDQQLRYHHGSHRIGLQLTSTHRTGLRIIGSHNTGLQITSMHRIDPRMIGSHVTGQQITDYL